MDPSGKGMLKVVSILFIIFGAIATVVSLIALLGASILAVVTVGLSGLLTIATIIALISSAAELVIGIIGLKKCADPAQAGFFIVTGIVLCVLTLVSMIMFFQITSLIGFVLPVLFIVGGFMNKNSVAAA